VRVAARSTRATVALERLGVPFEAHEYAVSERVGEGYGEAVAAAIGLPSERVLKTLVATVDETHVVAVIPVASRLSTRLLARAAAGKRAEMAPPAVAERLTGYVTGGISPFGQRRALALFVEVSVVDEGTVAVSGGVRGLQLEVSPADLIRVTSATVAPLIDEPARR
jgi:Cys-tRNA(Pro)/Cys-tRNA(Cys) deacylase